MSLKRLVRPLVLGFFLSPALSLIEAPNTFSQDINSACGSLRTRWEETHQELRDKVSVYVTLQQTPVERIANRPLVVSATDKPIAKQISEGLQIKEGLLSEKRKECRTAMQLENQLFEQLQECVSNSKSNKNKEIGALSKKRGSFIEKALVTISDVKEVEGQDTVSPYSEAMGGQDPYRRSVKNYWQNYQQQNRRWWGGYQ
jgi:hypothetical protein